MPGKAYYTRVASPGFITFPTNTDAGWDGKYPETTLLQTPWNQPEASPVSHLVAIAPGVTSGLLAGDIIGLFTPDNICCGAVMVEMPGEPLVINAFGDDPTTPAIDGMTEGEVMNFRIFNPETGKEVTLEVVFDAQMPQGRNFVSHGISAIKELKITGVDEVDNTRINISVYPNPSTGVFHVKTLSGTKASSEMSWEISNTHGAGIAKGNNSSDDFTIDISTYPKGIYYLKITQRGWQTVEKLVVQ